MGALELKNEFEKQVDRALGLVTQVETAVTPAKTRIPPLQRNLVFETAFLRILLGWEAFLEDVFLHFLTGGRERPETRSIPWSSRSRWRSQGMLHPGISTTSRGLPLKS